MINKIRIVTIMVMGMVMKIVMRIVRKMVMKMVLVRINDGQQVHYRNRGDATVFIGGHHAILE